MVSGEFPDRQYMDATQVASEQEFKVHSNQSAKTDQIGRAGTVPLTKQTQEALKEDILKGDI